MSLINVAHAAEATQAAEQPAWMNFLPFVLIFIVFYFLLIRPEKKRQQAHKDLISQVEKGEKIVTSSGMIGVISSIKDDIVSLKIASDVEIEIMRSSIADIVDSKKKNKKEKTDEKK